MNNQNTSNQTNLTQLRVGTAFSGIGSSSYALKKLGIVHTNEFMIEIDANARKTYLANHKVKKVYEDVRNVDPQSLPDIDFFGFGSPCQSFSSAGKRGGLEDTRGTLVYNGLQIIKAKQPKYFLYENVKGMINHDKGNTFKVIKEAFDELNYTISYQVLNAKHFGSPQNRERLFIIGIRKDIQQTFEFPQPLNKIVSVNSVIKKGEDVSHLLIRTDTIQVKKPSKKSDIKVIAEMGHVNYRSHKNIYSTNGISPCLMRGGSKANFYDTKNKVFRRLSERELARVQGYGDDFIFPVAKTHIKRQLGNSVAIKVMMALLNNLLKEVVVSNKVSNTSNTIVKAPRTIAPKKHIEKQPMIQPLVASSFASLVGIMTHGYEMANVIKAYVQYEPCAIHHVA
jgi:DNA (cytosine-5)-methyltransferase 1